jgi:predicted nucleic acid-binding protein
VIFLDTSFLVGSLTGPKLAGPLLLRTISRGEKIWLPAITLYEWLRGPRTPEELAAQEDLFPAAAAIAFEAEDAILAARLYRVVRRPRDRAADIALAASTIRHDAELWTLNVADFKDIPGLRLLR